jgi:glucosamine kinase
VQTAIREVVTAAGRTVEDVVGLVAGIAGFNVPQDHTWTEEFTNLPGLHCFRLHVNDALVAHRGAFLAQPGIIAIAGTGSMIFAMTDGGRMVRNFDFNHYAPAAARFLAYDAVFRIIAGDATDVDAEFVRKVLTFWEVPDIAGLREQAAGNAQRDERVVNRAYGNMAAIVTNAAAEGVPLACAVCDMAVREFSVGIRLVGNFFASDTVPFVLIGSAARSLYMRGRLAEMLRAQSGKTYQLVEPALVPVAGAVLIALEKHGIILEETLLRTLTAHPRAAFRTENTPPTSAIVS